ncbi:helix-turn-helix domain-containing protein [Holdemania massiliensis]|uniref:helix-turn-helix domain-containing protein n=1 Tax=Holdemania massiliensis TaxID=1468449 RepID=UPI002676C8BF|nr:helix-turn-helix transcriptional regulator [Holdemania massiliensis]
MNVNKLKGRIVEKGMNIDSLAREMGVNKSTLYRKIASDGDCLTLKDADSIVKILDLTKDEALAIFFD